MYKSLGIFSKARALITLLPYLMNTQKRVGKRSTFADQPALPECKNSQTIQNRNNGG